MIIFITKVAMFVSVVIFIFSSFVTIRSGSCLSGFGTLMLYLSIGMVYIVELGLHFY
jgi:hypothetical protein